MIEYLYPHMVHEYYVDKIRELSFERDQARRNIRSKNDVLKLKAIVRKKLAQSFGKLPEKTPLNARMTGRFEREKYIVEKIVFYSQPVAFANKRT